MSKFSINSLALLLLTVPLAAQEAPLLSATLSAPDTLLIGSPIVLDIAITHGAGDRLVLPDSLDLTPFEILDVTLSGPELDGNRATTTASLTVTAFEVGDLVIPPVPITVLHSDGVADTIRTDAVPISIQSVGLDPSGDIRDIKPPLSIARNWLLFLPLLLGIVALIALAIWLYRRRRKGDDETPVLTAPAMLPHEIAYKALDRLDRSDLLQRGLIKDYHIILSDIVRAYLLGRWDIDAIDMTSAEAIALLEQMPDIDGVEIVRCMDILTGCDMVKFAKHQPTIAQSRELIPLSRQFVDGTLKRPLATEEEVAA